MANWDFAATQTQPPVTKLMQTKPFKLVAVALANKIVRIAFAIVRGKTTYSAVRRHERKGSKTGHAMARARLSSRPRLGRAELSDVAYRIWTTAKKNV